MCVNSQNDGSELNVLIAQYDGMVPATLSVPH